MNESGTILEEAEDPLIERFDEECNVRTLDGRLLRFPLRSVFAAGFITDAKRIFFRSILARAVLGNSKIVQEGDGFCLKFSLTMMGHGPQFSVLADHQAAYDLFSFLLRGETPVRMEIGDGNMAVFCVVLKKEELESFAEGHAGSA